MLRACNYIYEAKQQLDDFVLKKYLEKAEKRTVFSWVSVSD
jgi:hypothetical protein